MTRTRPRTLVLSAIALAVVTSLDGPLSAQATDQALSQAPSQALAQPPSQSPAPRCVQGRPLPECSGFLLFELRAQGPLIQSTRTVTTVFSVPDRDGAESTQTVESQRAAYGMSTGLEVGYAWNRANGWALGATVGAELGGSDPRIALKGRVRRWLGREYSLELAPGIFSQVGDGALFRDGFGTTVEGRFNISDRGFFLLRYDRVVLDPERFDHLGGGSFTDPGGTHHGLTTGVGLGSQAGLVGTAVLGGVVGILYAVLIAR